jgi:hypothetical protein
MTALERFPLPWRNRAFGFADENGQAIQLSHPDVSDFVLTAVNAHAELLELAKQFAKTIEYYIRKEKDDDEGVRLKRMTLHIVRDVIARAEEPAS